MKQASPAIRNAEILGIFKINILKFSRPTPRSFFNCYNHKAIRLMTRPLGEWTVYVNMNSITIFKTVLILFAVVVWISNQRLNFFSLIWWSKNHSPEHSKQNWLQINRSDGIFFNWNATVWQFIVWFEKKTPSFFLMHPLITFYLLKDSKKPDFNKF